MLYSWRTRGGGKELVRMCGSNRMRLLTLAEMDAVS